VPRFGIGDIGRHLDRLTARRPDQVGGPGEILSVDVGDHRHGALDRDGLGDGPADAHGRPGDDGDVTG
jgi:hypothetical protein